MSDSNPDNVEASFAFGENNNDYISQSVADQILAMDLRKLGLSYREIGNRVGVPPETAVKLVAEEVKWLEELSEEEPLIARRLQLERINKVRMALMAKALKGDSQAVNALLRCGAQEAEILNNSSDKNETGQYQFYWREEEPASDDSKQR
jgi:hypothetical protein